MSAQIDAWKETYREHAVDSRPDPLMIVGAKRQYLMLESKEPCRDFTGGGGVMPLGHGHEQVGEAIRELTKYFYQTGPDTIQGIQMEFLMWVGKHFNQEWRYQFYASENEALMGVSDAFRSTNEMVDWINRLPPVWDVETWNDSVSERPDVALVAPINPDTYAPLTPEDLELVFDYHNRGVKIVWDETMLGMGWRGTTVFNTPFYADGVVLGGAVGGGVPLGVIGGAKQRLAPGGGRLAGSGIGITAGLHTLRQLMVLTAASMPAALVESLADRMQQLAEDHPDIIESQQGEGLLRSLRLLPDKIRPDEFVSACRDLGVLLSRRGEYVRVSVPLVCEQQDVDELFDIMTKAIKKVQDGHG